MAKLWVVIQREYLERVRTRWFVISTVLMPFALAAIFVLPAYLGARSAKVSDTSRIMILDATGTDMGEWVATRLLHGDSASAIAPDAAEHVRAVQPAQLAAAESTATQDVMQKRSSGYLVLDSAALAGKRARYAGSDASSLPTVERIERAVRRTLLARRLAGHGIPAGLVDSLTKVNLDVSAERITSHGRGGAGGLASTLLAYGIAFLLYMTLIIYGQAVLRGVMEEKTTRVAEVVVSSVSPETLLAGKVIGVGAVGLTQQLIWIVGSVLLMMQAAPLISRLGSTKATAAGAAGAAASAGPSFAMPTISLTVILAIVIFFVLGLVFYCSLYAALGATVNSEQEAQQASMPVMLLLIGTIIFISPVALNPTGTLAVVLSLLPFSAPIIMPMRAVMTPVPWYELLGSLASVGAGCAAAIWVAARIYRVGLLMYGKRPSYAELLRWIRYAH